MKVIFDELLLKVKLQGSAFKYTGDVQIQIQQAGFAAMLCICVCHYRLSVQSILQVTHPSVIIIKIILSYHSKNI